LKFALKDHAAIGAFSCLLGSSSCIQHASKTKPNDWFPWGRPARIVKLFVITMQPPPLIDITDRIIDHHHQELEPTPQTQSISIKRPPLIDIIDRIIESEELEPTPQTQSIRGVATVAQPSQSASPFPHRPPSQAPQAQGQSACGHAGFRASTVLVAKAPR
jgi:hypothetical protein